MKSYAATLTLLLGLAGLAPTLHAQGRSAPTRDPAAVAAIETAIAAMGGPMVGSVSDSVAVGRAETPGQSRGRPGNFVWKDSGEEFRREFAGPDGNQVFVSGHGRPAFSRGQSVRRLNYHVARANPPLHLPAVVLFRQLQNQGYSFELVGDDTWAGQPVTRVRTRLDSDIVGQLVTPQEWLFDQLTGLPLRVEYRVPRNNNAQKFTEGATEFSDFRPVAGVLVPHRLVGYLEGAQQVVATLTAVSFNQGISPSEFDSPAGGER